MTRLFKNCLRLSAVGALLAIAWPGTPVSMTQVSENSRDRLAPQGREARLREALKTLLHAGPVAMSESADRTADAILRASLVYDIPVSYQLAMIHQESRFDLNAHSQAGAVGLTQVLPATARAMDDIGIAPARVEKLADPEASVLFGAAYLARLKRQYHSWDRVFTVYNMGGGNYEVHQAAGETSNDYALAVLRSQTRWDNYLAGHGRMPLKDLKEEIAP